MSDGHELDPDLLEDRITTLSKLGELTGDLVATASRLAERLPMLGTAPPAVHLAMRLREAAGRGGLAGQVSAAEREVEGFQRTLSDARKTYLEQESGAESSIRAAGERGTGGHGSGGYGGSGDHGDHGDYRDSGGGDGGQDSGYDDSGQADGQDSGYDDGGRDDGGSDGGSDSGQDGSGQDAAPAESRAS